MYDIEDDKKEDTDMDGNAVTAASAVADVISAVMATITSITANPLVACAVALPLTGGVLGLAKRIFKSK